MKKKKGFTLVELLVAIVILGSILTLGALVVSSVNKNVKEKQLQNLESSIKVAARKYVNDTGIKKVYVETLVEEGLIEADDEQMDIQNPIDNTSMKCYIVDFSTDLENPQLVPGTADGDNNCPPERINDSNIFLTYCLVPNGISDCTPTTKLTNTSAIYNKWVNQNIILGVDYSAWKAKEADFNPENLQINWITPYNPTGVIQGEKYPVELPSSNYIDNLYQVKLHYNGKDYVTSGRIKIDMQVPVVKDMIVESLNKWTTKKKMTLQLEDKESGLLAYSISTSNNVSDVEWTNVDGKSSTIRKDILENGTYYVWVKDLAGNTNEASIEDSKIEINKIDNIPPTCTNSGDNETWTNEDIIIYWGCADEGGSDCEISSGGSKEYDETTKTDTIAEYIVKDNAGNETKCDSRIAKVYVDKTVPECTHGGDSTEWTNGNRVITWGCNDEDSKCDPNNSGDKKEYDKTTKTATINEYIIKDNAGNETKCESRIANIYVDKTKPTCAIPSGYTTWTNSNRTITWGCNDEDSKCDSNNSGDKKDYTTTTTTDYINDYTIKDNAGNKQECKVGSVGVYVDKENPVIQSFTITSNQADYNSKNVTLSIEASDEYSKVDKICITTSKKSDNCTWLNMTSDTYTNTDYNISTDEGTGDTKTLYAFVKDKAGNISNSTKATYTLYDECDETDYVDTIYYCEDDNDCGGAQYSYKIKTDTYLGTSCNTTPKKTGETCNSGCEEPEEDTGDEYACGSAPGDSYTEHICEKRCILASNKKVKITWCEPTNKSDAKCHYEDGNTTKEILRNNLGPETSCATSNETNANKCSSKKGTYYDSDCNAYNITCCTSGSCEYDERNGVEIKGTVKETKLSSSLSQKCKTKIICAIWLGKSNGKAKFYMNKSIPECEIIKHEKLSGKCTMENGGTYYFLGNYSSAVNQGCGWKIYTAGKVLSYQGEDRSDKKWVTYDCGNGKFCTDSCEPGKGACSN